MSRVYVWSDRSKAIGVLDATTAERQRPFGCIPPDANLLTSSLFAYNRNCNRLYAASSRQSAGRLRFALVYDCSTRAVTDSLVILGPGLEMRGPAGLSVNGPSNQVFGTVIQRYGAGEESTCTYAFDAASNEVRRRIPRPLCLTHHEARPIAYSCEPFPFGADSFLYVLDCREDSVVDSIQPPPGHTFHQPLLVASCAERLFAPACVPVTPRQDRVHVIDCLDNQVLGSLQLPGEVTSMVYNSLNSKLYAACQLPWPGPDKTYVIDATSVQVTDSLNVRGTLLYNPTTNHLYVLPLSPTGPAADVCVFDGATNQPVAVIPLPGVAYIGLLCEETNKLFVSDGLNVFLVDCDRLERERCDKLAYVNQNLMWQPVTNRLYVNDNCRDSFSSILTVYDAHTLQPLKVVDFRGQVAPGEWFYDFTTATSVNKVYLTSGQERGVYVLDGSTDSLLGQISGLPPIAWTRS
jgi:DNA-binding beta-propeller fold protein YncE